MVLEVYCGGTGLSPSQCSPIQQLWHESGVKPCFGPYHQTSLPDLTDAFVAEWEKMSAAMDLQAHSLLSRCCLQPGKRQEKPAL